VTISDWGGGWRLVLYVSGSRPHILRADGQWVSGAAARPLLDHPTPGELLEKGAQRPLFKDASGNRYVLFLGAPSEIWRQAR